LARSAGYAQTQFLIRAWWERQWRYLRPGYVYAPADLASWAATRLQSADPGALLWEVQRGRDYFQPDCDAFVFPTLSMRTWDYFRQALPGALESDFTPADLHFEPQRSNEEALTAASVPAAGS
jgi:hypothetical protein